MTGDSKVKAERAERSIFECKSTITWFEKGHVNGKQTREIYSYLKRELPTKGSISSKANDVSWNFAKFLVDSEGKPFKRYNSDIDPMDLRNDIGFLLEKKETDDAEKKAKETEKRAQALMKEVKEAEKAARKEEKKAARRTSKEMKLQQKLAKSVANDKVRAEQRLQEAEEKIKEANERLQGANKRTLVAKEAS